MNRAELMEAASLVSSTNKKEVARGLTTAVSIEQESIDLYSRLEKKIVNPELKKFFKFLVVEEEDHLSSINSLKESIESNGLWVLPELKKTVFSPFTPVDWEREEENAVSAVLFALWKERLARDFYLKIAEQLTDLKAKKFFEALAEFEKDHEDMLGDFVEESFHSNELIMG